MYKGMTLEKRLKLTLLGWNYRSQRVWQHNVASLINLIETWEYPSEEVTIDLDTLDWWCYSFECPDLYEFIIHCKLSLNSDLNYPIIIDHKWRVVDWRHRLIKAVLEWKRAIKWIQLLQEIYSLKTTE